MVFATALACAQQNYPVKPIVVLIPFPPGTGTNAAHVRADRHEPAALLGAGAAKALASKDVMDALANQGMETGHAGPVELEAYMKSETALWAGLVQELGVEPQ
jgi:tripartite-type tricarboxylate transporter receptor subunit TctC